MPLSNGRRAVAMPPQMPFHRGKSRRVVLQVLGNLPLCTAKAPHPSHAHQKWPAQTRTTWSGLRDRSAKSLPGPALGEPRASTMLQRTAVQRWERRVGHSPHARLCPIVQKPSKVLPDCWANLANIYLDVLYVLEFIYIFTADKELHVS